MNILYMLNFNRCPQGKNPLLAVPLAGHTLRRRRQRPLKIETRALRVQPVRQRERGTASGSVVQLRRPDNAV